MERACAWRRAQTAMQMPRGYHRKRITGDFNNQQPMAWRKGSGGNAAQDFLARINARQASVDDNTCAADGTPMTVAGIPVRQPRKLSQDFLSKMNGEGQSTPEPVHTGVSLASRRKSSTQEFIKRLNDREALNQDEKKTNPYHAEYQLKKFDKTASDYARPTPGSKTEARGKKAGGHVCREILFLCEIIDSNADPSSPRERRVILFGNLFSIYSRISENLVGMLIRARKYGLVDFEGEMLYQRQDDKKPVTMLMPYSEIKEKMQYSGDPANCVVIKK